MMEQEPRLTQDYTTDTRTTVADLPGFHEDADMRVKFVTDTISSWSVGDYRAVQSQLTFNPSFSQLDEEQILLMFDGTLKAIYSQEERIPEFAKKLDDLIFKYLKRGFEDGETKESAEEA